MKVFSLHDKLAEGPGSVPGQQISREGNAKRERQHQADTKGRVKISFKEQAEVPEG